MTAYAIVQENGLQINEIEIKKPGLFTNIKRFASDVLLLSCSYEKL